MSRTSDRRRPRSRRAPDAGFTLVELLVVLVILGLVMGLVAPRVLGYLSSSRDRAAELQIRSFNSAMDLFFLDIGRYPSATEGLQALVTRPGNLARWNGPYLQQPSVPADPWGNPYLYTAAGRSGGYAITSYGADGQKGGDDDIAAK
jgi:general secretion pathway protein G